MKEKLTKNISLKILSVIIAVLIWILISNIDDPIVPKRFRDVQVQILNENIINSLDQIYDIEEGETIDFTVEARRSIIDNLRESDFRVTADFNYISDFDTIRINISCPKYGNSVRVTDGNNQMMRIKREELIEDSFKVNVVTKGEVAEGFYIGDKNVSSNIIHVTGPKGRVEKIKEIVLYVDVTGASYSFQTSVKPKALDSDGREIDSDKLAFSQNEIEVNINMIKKKVIDLKIMTVGAPMKGYAVNGDIEYEPKQIVVAGDDSALQKLNNQLVIKENISGASESIEKEIDLQTLLPEGIILVDDNKAVAINIVIEKLISKDLTIWPMDIEQRTLDPTLRAIYSSPGSMTVKILGTQEAIDTLSITTPKPYINFSYLGVGTYSLRIEFDLPEGCILENTPIVGVQLIKK